MNKEHERVESMTVEQLQENINIATECGCMCHYDADLRHVISCCNACYLQISFLIGEINK